MCDHEPLCLSFECSSTELKCNLNSAGLPTASAFEDYMFCSKDPVDECGTTHNCDANAQCTNTPGSFTCGCNSGYTGSGVTCEDINECTLGSDGCDATAKCTNTVGSFSCECAAGYETAVTDSVCAGCADAVSIVDYSPAIVYCWSTKQWVSSCAGCANCASPEAVFDGSSTTFWNPQPSSSDVSLTLDLGAEVEVTGLDWTVYGDTSHDRAILDSYTSADGVTFTLNESKDLPSGGGASFVHTVTYDSPVTTRYLKLVARSGPYQIWLPALAISFGSPCPEDATRSMCPDIPLVCSDIDECYSPDDYNCATNAGCTNTVGSYLQLRLRRGWRDLRGHRRVHLGLGRLQRQRRVHQHCRLILLLLQLGLRRGRCDLRGHRRVWGLGQL